MATDESSGIHEFKLTYELTDEAIENLRGDPEKNIVEQQKMKKHFKVQKII